MSESISKRMRSLPDKDAAAHIEKVLLSMATDFTDGLDTLAAVVVDLAALAAAVDALAAKLNADAGVTDEDYSEGNVAALTSEAPATPNTTA